MSLHRSLALFLLAFHLCASSCWGLSGVSPLPHPKTLSQMQHEGRELVRDIFERAFTKYLDHAFPRDELAPLSCRGVDNFGGVSVSIIDALDTLAVMGLHDDFRDRAAWVCDNIDFATKDVEVSVFETTIRVVGGLLGAHFAYENGLVQPDDSERRYDGCLLAQAVSVADRLMPAFDTKTGVPYGTINLKRGIKRGESMSTSTACGGTLLLEFTILSAVTGDPKYEKAARRAAVALFVRRNPVTGLVGSHINISNGAWVQPNTLLGVSIDSYLEYLLKAFILAGDPLYESMSNTLRKAFRDNVMRGTGFGIEVKSDDAQVQAPLHNSLANFYPSLLVLNGQLAEADAMVNHQHALFSRFGAMPEGFHLFAGAPPDGQKSAPLRPEHAESLYYLYRATGDAKYIEMAFEMVNALEIRHRVPCGYASVKDVTASIHAAGKLQDHFEDRMDSYFFAETLKYLFLIFDEHNAIHGAASLAEDEAGRSAVLEAQKAHNDLIEGIGQQHETGASSGGGGDEGSCSAGPQGPTMLELTEAKQAASREAERSSRTFQEGALTKGLPRALAGVPWMFNTEGHLLPVTAEWSDYVRAARKRDGDHFPLGPVREPPPLAPSFSKLPFV